MSLERINSFALQQTVINGSSKVLADLTNLQRQLSSGYNASSFAELGGGQTQILSSLTTNLQRTTGYVNNNTLIVSRLQNTNQALSNIIDIANSVTNAITQKRNGATGVSLPFNQQLDNYQQTLSGQLNTNIEGRYLFSGSRTDTPPIRSDIPQPQVPGTLNAGYYQGSTQDLVTMVQDNYPLTYNIRADNTAFQQIYAGIALAKNAASDDDLGKAYTLVQQGLAGVTALQAQTNTNIVNIQDINSQLQSFQTYWKNASDAIDKTDIVSVSTQVALDESTLTASYQTYARIVSLKLSDYLK
jgi:flagellar hook-associated protein 3 FlgL